MKSVAYVPLYAPVYPSYEGSSPISHLNILAPWGPRRISFWPNVRVDVRLIGLNSSVECWFSVNTEI